MIFGHFVAQSKVQYNAFGVAEVIVAGAELRPDSHGGRVRDIYDCGDKLDGCERSHML